MRYLSIFLLSTAVLATAAEEPSTQIEVTYAVECDRRTTEGDTIHVHYRGTLAADETEFDTSESSCCS